MLIDENAEMAVVVQSTVAALQECGRHIGKADRSISAEQIHEVEAAIRSLQNALSFKKRLNTQKV